MCSPADSAASSARCPFHLQSPCILFIDEFDGIGKARSYSGGGNDESVHTINQLLTGGWASGRPLSRGPAPTGADFVQQGSR